jgi:AcrR family transcriptional regulator
MSETALTREAILEAAEEVLRRHGPAKANVVDVARALGVSHGSVYRHFESKAALRDAVAVRWLSRISAPLAEHVQSRGPAARRLRAWFDRLIVLKQGRRREEPEHFENYVSLVKESRAVIAAHVAELTGQVAEIIRDGMATGEFRKGDAESLARSVFYATARFHNPMNAAEWTDPRLKADFEGMWELLLRGLGHQAKATERRALRSRE